jgi:hypothetical protein
MAYAIGETILRNEAKLAKCIQQSEASEDLRRAVGCRFAAL